MLRRGPGLTVLQISTYLGGLVESVGDIFIRGPVPFKSRIEHFFGVDNKRETVLDELYANQDCSSGRLKALQRHCDNLLRFARSE
jgi:hypothetical protein